MSRIVITGDTTSAQQALRDLQAAMTAQTAAAQQMIETQIRRNAQGVATTRVIKEITDAENTLESVQRRNNGAWETRRSTIERTTTAMQSQLSVQKQLATAAAAPAVFQSVFRPNTTLTEAGSQQLKDLMNKLAQQSATAAPGGLAAAQITQMMDNLKNGTFQFVTGPLAAVEKTLFKILELYRKQEEEVNKIAGSEKNRLTAAQAEAAIRAMAAPTGRATQNQLTQYEIALSRIIKLAQDGKITIQQINDVLNSRMFSGMKGSPIPPLDPGVLSSFQALKAAIDVTTLKSNALNNSWSKLIKMAESRIISNIVSSAFNTISNSISTSIEQAKLFQIQISQIRTISQDNQLSFGAWSQKIREVSDNLGLGLTDVAEGAYSALSNQVVKSGQAFEFLNTAGQFARTTVATTAESVNLLSSVINSYRLSVGDAEHISAILFKTIELGRVRASEMANTFGRTAFLANGLGVSLEELSSMIATLTVQGIKYTDANTLISNVLLKLYKPTEAMKELYKQWGVETGEQAVQMLGFAGVMRKLAAETKNGSIEINQLFNELRGLKGAEGLIGAFDTFEENLTKITNSVDNYQRAVQIRGESPADYLNIELNKFQNILTQDLGQALVNGLGVITKYVGGLQGLVKWATILGVAFLGLKATTAVYTTYTVASSAATATAVVAEQTRVATLQQQIVAEMAAGNATAVATLQLQLQNGAIVANIGMWNRAKIALAAVPWIAAAAAIAYLAYELNKSKEAITGVSEAMDIIVDSMRELNAIQKTASPEAILAAQDFAKTKANIANIGQTTLRALAEMTKLNDKAIEDIQSGAKATKDVLANSMKGFADGLKNSIADIKSRITEAKNAVKDSFKFMEGLKDSIGKTIYGAQFNLADQQQKVLLINKESARLRQEAQQNFDTGLGLQLTNPEEAKAKIETARKQIQELIALAEQKNSIVNEMNKANFEEFLKTNPTWAQIPGGNTFIGNTQQLQKTLESLYSMQLTNEDRLKKVQQERIKQLEDYRKKEEERLTKFEAAYKQFSDFTLTDKTGAISSQYKNPLTGGINAEKAKQDLDDIITKLKDTGITKNMSLNDRIQFTLLVEQRKTQIIAEAEAFRIKQSLEAEKTKVSNQIQVWQDGLNKQKAIASDAVGNIMSKNGLIDKTLTLLDQYDEIANRGTFDTQAKARAALEDAKNNAVSIGDIFKNLSYRFAGAGTQGPAPTLSAKANDANLELMEKSNVKAKQLKETIAAARIEIERIRQNGVLDPLSGKLVPSEHDLLLIKRQFDIIEAGRKQLTELYTAPGAPVAIGEKDKLTIDSDQLRKSAELQLQKLLEERGKIGQAGGDVERIKREAEALNKAVTDPLIARFPQIADAATIANKTIKSSFDLITDSIGDLIRALDALQDKMKNMPQRPAVPVSGIDAPTYAATGSYFPGSPRGEDRIPIWAKRGEFLVNAESAARNFSLLQRINNQPKYMASGGSVTNVGDINISVDGNNNPSMTVREIGTQLRREIKRGTIKLS